MTSTHSRQHPAHEHLMISRLTTQQRPYRLMEVPPTHTIRPSPLVIGQGLHHHRDYCSRRGEEVMMLVTGAISGLPSFSRPGSSSPLLPSSASARQPGSIEKKERGGEREREMVIMIRLLLRHTHAHLHAMPCHFDAYCKRGKNSEDGVGMR